jgi:molybdopterin biosynthesis enzyme
MKARRISRGEGLAEGMVLAQDVRDAAGAVIIGKGTVLGREALGRAGEAPWTELHVVEMEPGDVHEDEGGRRIAAAMAGAGVEASKTFSTGAFSLTATKRGLLEVDAEKLGRLNEIEDVAAFALPHRRVVVEGEVVARAKIVPFVTREDRIRGAEEEARGTVRVREFVPLRVTVLVQEELREQGLAKFRAAMEEKLRFFGAPAPTVARVASSAEALASALREAVAGGAQLVLVAGSRPMDPLDPALDALARAGAQMLKSGVPAHPGTLLWVAELGTAPIVGMPTCGMAAKATTLDLVLPRLFAGERLTRKALARLGDGGLFSADTSHLLPPYRTGVARGELGPP